MKLFMGLFGSALFILASTLAMILIFSPQADMDVWVFHEVLLAMVIGQFTGFMAYMYSVSY